MSETGRAGSVVPEGIELAETARLADLRGLRLLEVGAGDGRLTWEIAEVAAHVLATDPDEESIGEARASVPPALAEKVSFAVCEAADVDVEPASFDGAFFTWSLC